jgi:hypothetical protein
LWQVDSSDGLLELTQAKLNLESRIEGWLEQDIGIIADDLLIIARQFETNFGGIIDLLCIDHNGDLVIVELKRDKTPRDITSQALDYASSVKDFSYDRVVEIANGYLGHTGPLDHAFNIRFGAPLPDMLNERQRMLIVGSSIDSSTERIVTYLSDTFGVGINVATFNYYKAADGREFLARVFLLDPAQVEQKSDTVGAVKRKKYLTPQELQGLADQNGVGPLYAEVISSLAPLFKQTWTSLSSFNFVGDVDGSPRVIIRLVPGESSTISGVKFQVYITKFNAYFGLDEQAATALLPANKQVWAMTKGVPDESGYEAFFSNSDDLVRLATGLKDRQAANNSWPVVSSPLS